MRSVLALIVVAAALLSGSIAYAHHSFAATYREDQTIRIEGKLIQFLFRNPHSFVHVMAPDEKGVMHRWSVEWGGAGQLGSQGVTRYSLQAGDEVTITGAPGRDPGDHRIMMRTLHRKSDGFGWGSRPGEVVD